MWVIVMIVAIMFIAKSCEIKDFIKENYEDCKEYQVTIKRIEITNNEPHGCYSCLLVEIEENEFLDEITFYPNNHEVLKGIEPGKEYIAMECADKRTGVRQIIDLS